MNIKILIELVKNGGRIYMNIEEAVDCTNGREETPMVIYQNVEGEKFVRELDEFNEKFTIISDEHIKYIPKHDVELFEKWCGEHKKEVEKTE